METKTEVENIEKQVEIVEQKEDAPILLVKTKKAKVEKTPKVAITDKQKETLAKAREFKKAKKLLGLNTKKEEQPQQQEDDYKKHIMDLNSRIAALENALSNARQTPPPQTSQTSQTRPRTIPRF